MVVVVGVVANEFDDDDVRLLSSSLLLSGGVYAGGGPNESETVFGITIVTDAILWKIKKITKFDEKQQQQHKMIMIITDVHIRL